MKTKAATKSKKPQVKVQDIKPKHNPFGGKVTGKGSPEDYFVMTMENSTISK